MMDNGWCFYLRRVDAIGLIKRVREGIACRVVIAT
jgi:hypothetical protein